MSISPTQTLTITVNTEDDEWDDIEQPFTSDANLIDIVETMATRLDLEPKQITSMVIVWVRMK